MAAVTTAPKNINFPLTAVIGQESIKLALLLAAIDPELGGAVIGLRPRKRLKAHIL
jgi:magnesium chelatase subunit D